MTPELIQKLAAPLPRYTSYPTANHFDNRVAAAEYGDWLNSLDAGAHLSLYLHIPYCRELCWYCGCATKATQRYEPVADYIGLLEQEAVTVSRLLPHPHAVKHVHWGGGSPDILNAADILRLGRTLQNHFTIDADAEIAVEIDPRLLAADQADSFAAIGVNRISVGVQDFDPAVQKAIGRIQSYETTAKAVSLFRERGVGSVNIDLVYGLPHQTIATLEETIRQVLTLAPDRIAIFGYAHLPSRLKHQRLIDDAALPDALARYAQARRLEELLAAAGFAQVGLDHFAKPEDGLAKSPLARNFQGYTTDQAESLIGLGASAISKLPGGFAQNAVAVDEYARRLGDKGLATARGWTFSTDDTVRAHVIERLMCDFTFSGNDLARRFGGAARQVLDIALDITREDRDGFIEPAPGGFRLSARGRPFVRNIAARFDRYLVAEVAQRRHALSV